MWADPSNAERKIGLLSQWGLADPETCPFQWVCNVAVQSQGLLPQRTRDTTGVAYFYSGLSRDVRNLLNPLEPVGDLHGVELCYSAEITSWFHVTADLQVVEPAIVADDAALVVGLRGKVGL